MGRSDAYRGFPCLLDQRRHTTPPPQTHTMETCIHSKQALCDERAHSHHHPQNHLASQPVQLGDHPCHHAAQQAFIQHLPMSLSAAKVHCTSKPLPHASERRQCPQIHLDPVPASHLQLFQGHLGLLHHRKKASIESACVAGFIVSCCRFRGDVCIQVTKQMLLMQSLTLSLLYTAHAI